VVGVNYADECFSFALEGARNLIREESGESGTVLMLRLGLRNLGEFATPKIKFGATSQNDGR
jgi:LPS-assembly protein